MTKKMVISIVSAFIGVMAFYALKYVLTPIFEDNKINNYLKKEAEAANKDCPYAVNDELMVERISFGKNKKLIFEYRYLNYSKSDFNAEELKNFITGETIEMFGSDKTYDEIRNKDVIFEFVYYDNQYEEISRIKILLNTPVTAVD
jgi:hypothetical protein